MVQLNILSGKMAGTSWVTRRFPVRIGRAPSSELRLEEPGVWDQHLLLESDPAEGFLLKSQPPALARINGQPLERAALRNGDIIELGSLRIQFWLAQARQRRLRLGEAISWLAIILVSLAQIVLFYWLLK